MCGGDCGTTEYHQDTRRYAGSWDNSGPASYFSEKPNGYRNYFSKYFSDVLSGRPLKTQEFAEDILEKAPAYKPVIEMTVTNNYTASHAWAHILPEDKRACQLSEEHFPYWKQFEFEKEPSFDVATGHEIGHWLLHLLGLPQENEDGLTRNAHHYLNSGACDIRYRRN